jgi:hypothetical protein
MIAIFKKEVFLELEMKQISTNTGKFVLIKLQKQYFQHVFFAFVR